MKNVGISSYAAIDSKTFEDIATINLNIVPDTWNAHIIMPIYESTYVKPLSFSLIYDNNNPVKENGILQKFNSEHEYKVITGDNSYSYYFVDPYGKKYGLTLADKQESIGYQLYENKELELKLSILRETYHLYFKDKTTVLLTPAGDHLAPRLMTKVNKDVITYTYDGQGRLIQIENDAKKKEKIVIERSNLLYTYIKIYKQSKEDNNTYRLIKACKVTKLENLSYKIDISENITFANLIKSFSLVQTVDENYFSTFVLTNLLTNKYVEFKIAYTGAIHYYKNELGHITNYSYQNSYYSKKTNYKGRQTKQFIDNDGRLICIKDEFLKRVKYVQYDVNNKKTIESRWFYFNHMKNGKLIYKTSSATSENVSISQGELPEFLSEYYMPSEVIKIEGTNGNVRKFVNIYTQKGTKFDIYSVGVWAKAKSYTLNAKAKVNIYFVNGPQNMQTSQKFSQEINIVPNQVEEFVFYATAAYSLQDFDKIYVEIEYVNTGDMSCEFIIDLYKSGMAIINGYDDKGNIITKLNGKSITEAMYNEDNTIYSTSYSQMEYDDRGNVIKEVDGLGLTKENTYDTSNNLIKQIISDGTRKIQTETTYEEDEAVIKNINENGTEINFENDNKYQKILDKIPFNDNNKMHVKYIYDQNNSTKLLEKEYTLNGTNYKGNVKYQYDSINRLYKIGNNENEVKYEMLYDSHNRQIGMKVYSLNHVAMTYQNYNGLPTELLDTITYGVKDGYRFLYDDRDRVSCIKYIQRNSTEEETLVEYTYDEFDNIEVVTDYANNLMYLFDYDENNNPISFICRTINGMEILLKEKTILDDKNNIVLNKIVVNETKFDSFFNSTYKIINRDIQMFKNKFRTMPNYLTCFFDKLALKVTQINEQGESEEINLTDRCKLLASNKLFLSKNGKDDDQHCSNNGFIPVFNNTLEYEFASESSPFKNTSSILFVFKTNSSSGNSKLIKLSDSSKDLIVEFNNTNNKILVKEGTNTILTTTDSFNKDLFHTICFTYNKEEKKVNLKVDDKEYNGNLAKTYDDTFNKLYLAENINGNIATLIITENQIVDNDTYKAFNKSINYLLFVNEGMKDNNGNIVNHAIENKLINFNYPYVPLHNSAIGIDDDVKIYPTTNTVLDIPIINASSSEYIYDKTLKNFAYLALGQDLIYNFNQTNTGTLSINVKSMKIDAENVIFDIKDDNNHSMCLSLVNNAFKLVVGEQTFMSDSIENLDRLTSWNRITFTWQIQSNNSKFKIYLNSSLVKQVETSINYTLNNLLVSIGKKFEDDSTSFNGLMEMLVYETQDISNNLYPLILKLIQKETINYTFDSLNMLISKSVKETEVLKNTYTYKIENEKQTQLVNKEDIIMTNETISNQYEYDSLGNVTLIKKNNETIHSYAYDELFRLKQATCYGDTFKYEYDVNGNITSIKDGNNNTLHTFTYSTTYKDMLIKYDNIDITYSNLACYNITGIGNNITLTYKAKDLETYSDSSKQIYERYYYNDKHLRVKKEILDNNGNVTSTITYTYDNNDNLIYQKQGNISLTFLYDNSNMLYGFIYNGYTYYYIRSILNDILGIVDIQGNKIVEYRYLDAWGNHSVFSRKVIHRSSISDSIIDGTIENVPNTNPSFIGNINPFRYKGYYYDKETGLFMMGQRYYNPEWGRFIQPADVSMLSPSSINGLNLYAYANNNPVSAAYSVSDVSGFSNGGMVSSTRGTFSTIDGSVIGGTKIRGFGSLGVPIFASINWPKANSVAMTHYTTSLIENAFIGSLFGNISYTVTTQLNDSEMFYSYSNIGNGGYSAGVGMNLGNWYGISAYVSSNLGFGTSMQITPWITYGAEISLQDGISFSFGTISGNTTQEITANVGWGTIAGAFLVCAGIAAIPMPGARVLAGAAACVILLIDIFN